ncbi:MAG TPA: glycosyltransferase [Streptosporangiaceae bacterium]|jgi:glycosyltransferase involved in cell wall biosynthesis
MPLLSIVTAAHSPSAKFLPETMASVAAQELPDGWELEWMVQEDGPESSIADTLKPLSVAQYRANGSHLGIAPTRNFALSRASGSLVQALDQDDVLLPGHLATLISRFVEYPIHWAVGQADDLLPDGTRRAYPSDIAFGVQTAGYINEWAARNGGNWPIHCAALMMRASSLRALGGWGGIPYDDEISLFAALSEITDGYYDEAVTWLYRQHPLQTHRTELSRDWSADCRRIALQRATAVRVCGLRLDEVALPDFEETHNDIRVGPAVKEERTKQSNS